MYKIFDDGKCIKVEKNGKVFFITKAQIKTIDILHDNVIRVDIGEGALRNVFFRFSEVELPVVLSVEELRDRIKDMISTDVDSQSNEQIKILEELRNITGVLNAMKLSEADLLRTEPTRIDESNPNTIYKGWHAANGFVSEPEWAILKVTQDDDNIIYQWANGNTKHDNVWDSRYKLSYYPLNQSRSNY